MWQHNNQEPNKDVIAHSIGWIASIGAAVMTFFVTPLVYQASVSALSRFTAKHYGQDFVFAVELGWFPVVLTLVYFLLRALTAFLLRLGQLLAARIG